LRGREGGDRDHEVSILIRLGDGERAGRAPSKVSTTIIRPPQQGHRRAGEGVSASPSASAHGRSGAASAWRARDVAGSNRAGEEAVVADAVEAAGQHVQEKAADELGRVERIGLRRSRPLIR